jgi:hypothetical protein
MEDESCIGVGASHTSQAAEDVSFSVGGGEVLREEEALSSGVWPPGDAGEELSTAALVGVCVMVEGACDDRGCVMVKGG